ncbi:MAG TPA: lysophospholipid acyltransferase family protein [Gemmataceae bacterium]
MPVPTLTSPAAVTPSGDPPPSAPPESPAPAWPSFNPPLSRTAMPAWLAYAWYEFCYWLTMAIMTLCFSLRMTGRRNIPRRGAALLIGNHQSFLDPLVIGISSPRHLCFLARKTLFRNRLFGTLLSSWNTVPVDQEGVAKEGLKTILEELKHGSAVLVFPEGQRTWDGNLQPLKPGIQLLIKRSNAPIVPIGVAGAFNALPRGKNRVRFSPWFLPATDASVAVHIGKPLDSQRFAEMPREEMLTALLEELRKVHEQAERLRRKP